MPKTMPTKTVEIGDVEDVDPSGSVKAEPAEDDSYYPMEAVRVLAGDKEAQGVVMGTPDEDGKITIAVRREYFTDVE